MTTAERQLADCYEQLARVLSEHGDDLPPFAQRGAIKALGTLWQVANGLDLEPGHIYDLGA